MASRCLQFAQRFPLPIIINLVTFYLLTGCRSCDERWSQTRSSDTASAYRLFLQACPARDLYSPYSGRGNSSDLRRFAVWESETRIIWLAAVDRNDVSADTYTALKDYQDALQPTGAYKHPKYSESVAQSKARTNLIHRVVTCGPQAQRLLLDILKFESGNGGGMAGLEFAAFGALAGLDGEKALESIFSQAKAETRRSDGGESNEYAELFCELAKHLGNRAEPVIGEVLVSGSRFWRKTTARVLSEIPGTLATTTFLNALKNRDFEIIVAGIPWYLSNSHLLPETSDETILDAFYIFGDRDDATLLLNSKKQILVQAVEAWAKEHNLRIIRF